MNVLLPTDFSENSKNAITYALNLFKNQECTFYFLHGFPKTIYSYEEQVKAGAFGNDLIEKETQKKEAQLESLITELKELINPEKQKTHCIIARDFTTDAIKETAEEKEIDIIVLGTKGETSSSSVIFGSITSYVLTKIKTPTLAIPSGYKFGSIKNILFPSDFLVKHNTKVVQPLKSIATLSNGEITTVHCSTNDLSEKQQQNSENLTQLLADLKLSNEILKSDNFITSIENKMNYFDMLFMINNKKSFFENLFFTPTVSKVAVSINKPLLVSHF